MNDLNLLTFSYLVPLFSLTAMVYRRLVFKYWDLEFMIFGVFIGLVPIANWLTGLSVLFCFLGDVRDTAKAWSLDEQALQKFAHDRTTGGWEY